MRADRGWARVTALSVSIVLALTLVLPQPSAGSGLLATEVQTPQAVASSTSDLVTWNGVDIGTAGTTGSAFVVDFASKSIDVRFHWSQSAASNVGGARLQMFYFGYAISTRDVVQAVAPGATNGTFDMAWDAVGSLRWILEGTFAMRASVIDTSGVALTTQGFYVHIRAPYNVLAVIPVALILLILFELWGVAVSGRAATASKPEAPPEPSASAKEPAEGGGEEPGTSAPEEGPSTSGGSS